MRDRYVTVGQSVRRVEGFEKVTGRSVYVDDISFPDMLHAAILKSPYAHAKIVNIDVSKALKLPGVKAVITGKDAAEAFFKRRGEDLDRWDRNCVLSVKKVRYVNEPVAAVAAVDKDIALEALDLIEVEYEELPAVFSPEEALKEGAPLLHEGKKDNVGTRFRHEFGDVAKGLEEAYYVREDTYHIPPMAHVCMEPRGTVAKYDPVSGKLTLWSSHQAPFILRAVLARTLGWEETRIRVIKPYVGSGFGGKMAGVAHLPILELFPNDICAALLAIKTGRPVKLVLTREEEFTITRLSQPMIIKLKTGVRKDGSIVAKDIDILIDGGAYDSPIGAGVNYLSSIWLTLPYKQENFRFDIKRVFTNKPISGALRGYA
ncbi:MAG: 4-hydroxybenzoyl-CoA reductase, partial [Deltaproteobacteria bacterium]